MPGQSPISRTPWHKAKALWSGTNTKQHGELGTNLNSSNSSCWKSLLLCSCETGVVEKPPEQIWKNILTWFTINPLNYEHTSDDVQWYTSHMRVERPFCRTSSFCAISLQIYVHLQRFWMLTALELDLKTSQLVIKSGGSNEPAWCCFLKS